MLIHWEKLPKKDNINLHKNTYSFLPFEISRIAETFLQNFTDGY